MEKKSLKTLVDASNLLDKLNETKLANRLDRLVKKALDEGGQDNPDNAQWLITKDKINEGGDMGVSSRNYKGDKKALKYRFRMLDDDKEVYYYGLCSDNSSFAPIDDFGEGNAGCTIIQYYENGKWETL